MAYQQTAGAIAGLYEFAPQEEVEAPEVAKNGQAPELELAEAWKTHPILFPPFSWFLTFPLRILLPNKREILPYYGVRL